MAVYSKLLGRGVLAGAGSTTLFTASSGVTTVIRDISITWSAGCTEVFVFVNGVITFFQLVITGGAAGMTHQECRIVLEVGDVVDFATSGGAGECYVSGYQLS